MLISSFPISSEPISSFIGTGGHGKGVGGVYAEGKKKKQYYQDLMDFEASRYAQPVMMNPMFLIRNPLETIIARRESFERLVANAVIRDDKDQNDILDIALDL
jgi:hypothetical protein